MRNCLWVQECANSLPIFEHDSLPVMSEVQKLLEDA